MADNEFQDQGALDEPQKQTSEADPTVEPDNTSASTLAQVNEAREAGDPLTGSPDLVDQPAVTPEGTGVADGV